MSKDNGRPGKKDARRSLDSFAAEAADEFDPGGGFDEDRFAKSAGRIGSDTVRRMIRSRGPNRDPEP